MHLKRLLILLCVFTATLINSFSQTYVEDSLTQQIFIEQNPHKKIGLMGELSWSLMSSDSQKALEIARQADDLANVDSKKDVIYTKNLIGNAFLSLEKDDSALYYFIEVNKMSELAKDSSFMAKSLNNLGVVYFNQGNYEKGIEYMSECAALEVSMNNLSGAIGTYMNIGAAYIALEEYDKAEQNLYKALKLGRKTGNQKDLSGIYLNLGTLEVNRGNLSAGKTYFFDAIEIQKNMNDIDGVARSYNNLAIAFRQQGKHKIALVYDLKSLEYADILNSTDARMAAYKGLASTYEDLGEFEKALENYRYYMACKDTIIKQENDRSLIEMQEKYRSEQTLKENEILVQQNKIDALQNKENRAKLNQSRIIIVSSVLGLLLLIGLAVVLFNRNRLKQRANLELQDANSIIQEKNNDITASIEYASKIQEALLPTKENSSLFKDSFFILLPKDIVSGDFFWYSKIGNKVVFTAADCTGHGVPGAFMSMIGNTYLQQIVNERKVLTPSLILDELRANVIGALSPQGAEKARKDGMDMALCVLDLDTKVLEFAGANNPLYYVNKNVIKEVKPDKQPVGYMPERNDKFTNHRIQLEEGDAVYIFSDGFADQFGGPKGKKYKYQQLRDILLKNYSQPMNIQKEELLSSFKAWKGDLEQIDDVCLIGARI